jgi:hypothetical protein
LDEPDIRVGAIEGVHGVVHLPVGRHHVQQRLACSGEVEHSWWGAGDSDADESSDNDDDRLVDRGPEVDEVAVLPCDVGGVLRELVGDVRVEPTRRGAEVGR